jgi:hypothetical protein
VSRIASRGTSITLPDAGTLRRAAQTVASVQSSITTTMANPTASFPTRSTRGPVELGEHFETKIINGQWISHRDCSAWGVVELKPAVNDDLDALIAG